MKEFLAKYQSENPEQFNEELFKMREKENLEAELLNIFKTLEILDSIEIEYVRIEEDESQIELDRIGFFDNQPKKYFKQVAQSRLSQINYSVIITPSESITAQTILSDDGVIQRPEKVHTPETYRKKGFFFINKLVDSWFYINEASRYYLIYQIVDNATYGTGDSISLKSLLMPITIQKKNNLTLVSEVTNKAYPGIPSFDLLLFAKKINPLLYVLAKYSFNDIVRMGVLDPERIIELRNQKRCPEIVDKFNEFFHVNLKFSNDISTLMEEGREIFKTSGDQGVFISVEKDKLESRDQNLMAILGCLFDIEGVNGKKKKTMYTYDNLITPSFWIDQLSTYFTKNTDPLRRFDKIKTMLISLDRLTDDKTRSILRYNDEDKKNTLTIIRYLLRNFNELSAEDPNNFNEKRLRLSEYMLFGLRSLLSSQIYRVLNAPTHSKKCLDRIFSSMTPVFLLKATITNELLRYYNSTNDLNFFSVLSTTQLGPQSLGKTVNNSTRDVQPSQTGRLSLVSASSSNPGLTSRLCPFCKLDGMYFAKINKKKEG